MTALILVLLSFVLREFRGEAQQVSHTTIPRTTSQLQDTVLAGLYIQKI
jgi:hypothetical protein